MKENFIKKFETDKYLIGSFDAYLEENENLINSNNENKDELLKKMPTTYRASIVSKEDNSYVGFISTIDMNNQYGFTSLIFETKKALDNKDLESIIDTYKEFLSFDLGITEIKELILVNEGNIKEEHKEIVVEETTVKSNYLHSGISDDEKKEFESMGYKIPNMSLPCTIKNNTKTIGLIGLTNLIWSNRRANLQIFFNKEIDNSFIEEFGPVIIDDYLKYLHNSNLYSISTSISGSNKDMLNIITNSNMNFYAAIPYAAEFDSNIETNYLFESYPNMKKENGIYLPENKIIVNDSEIERNFSEIIDLQNGFVAISPKVFEKKNVDVNKIVKGHIEAMQNRDKFSIPLGEDKYILQVGNGNYGISKAINNFSYILVDQDLNYSGYVNILRENAKNAEIEVGIKPDLQKMGLGTSLVNGFYKELFNKGYMSVTGSVFDFNEPSKRLNEKIAKFSGKRIGAYYINGKLWDMNMYTKLNPEIEELKNYK